MSTQLHITEPCHEDWHNMIPNDQGRHCDQCCKTVIDFTNWETVDILHYLQQHKNACGRLRKDQLAAPPDHTQLELIPLITTSSLSYVKKMTAVVALLFVFASCGNQTDIPVSDTAVQSNTVTHTLGKPIAVPPPPEDNMPPTVQLPKRIVHTPEKEGEEVVLPNESYVQGGISFPDPPEQPVIPVQPPADTLKMGPFPE